MFSGQAVVCRFPFAVFHRHEFESVSVHIIAISFFCLFQHYNSHLESATVGSPDTGAVYRALPVYRVSSESLWLIISVIYRVRTRLENP